MYLYVLQLPNVAVFFETYLYNEEQGGKGYDKYGKPCDKDPEPCSDIDYSGIGTAIDAETDRLSQAYCTAFVDSKGEAKINQVVRKQINKVSDP